MISSRIVDGVAEEKEAKVSSASTGFEIMLCLLGGTFVAFIMLFIFRPQYPAVLNRSRQLPHSPASDNTALILAMCRTSSEDGQHFWTTMRTQVPEPGKLV